jgi:hypothetical protein
MLRQIQHFFRDLRVLDLVEVFGGMAHLVRVAQQNPHQTLVSGLQRNDVLAAREHYAAQRYPIHRSDRLSDHGICIMAYLTIGHDVVWPHQCEQAPKSGSDAILMTYHHAEN